MIALTYKAKNYATLALKVGILSISFYYLFTKLTDQQLYLDSWWQKLKDPIHFLTILGLLTLSAFNWLFESRKWQLLVECHQPISFRDAFMQTLAALSVSVATPNRIGEYGAKAYFFPRKYFKRILFLNGVGNIVQMSITVLFGLLGYFLGGQNLPMLNNLEAMVGFLLLGTVLLWTVFLFLKKSPVFSSLPLHPIRASFKRIPRQTTIKVALLSMGRYLLFSTQFYLILLLMGADLNPWIALPIIYVMYLFTSILPMFPFLDVVVKGSVAVWLFQAYPISEITVLTTVLGVWIFNLVIPSIFGSFQLIKAPN